MSTVPVRLRAPLIALLGLALVGALWTVLWTYNGGASTPPSDPVAQAASAATLEPPHCHASAFAEFEETSEGDETRRVVPADENPLLPGVEVEVVTSSGSSLSSTLVTLREPAKGRTVEASFETSFEQMVSEHPVPEELRGAAGEGWRRLVEEAAFETICDKPEPSLARLLSADERLRWLPGAPEMPQNYALYVEPPAPDQPHWIEYLGWNHQRLTEDALGERLEVIDRKGKLELLRSGHGAVVQDLERNVYAWVYVFPGGRKLRWPSVVGGKLEDGTVVLQIDHPLIGESSQRLRIDLESGVIRPAG